ncbi:MAG: hypothetical protein NC200_08645 [Candidatus Gastranaerophilales bacterium]|nr:hypothetical protein [Candidatus Gastranaerophilales bacterium]
MKKLVLLLIIAIISSLRVFADVLPVTTNDIPTTSIGMYQTGQKLVVYSQPNSDSKVIFERDINYSMMFGARIDNMFGVLVPQKELGYVYATDCDEDWVEVIYDKNQNLKGWVHKDDDFQFLPWVTFYNMYGRKYGLIQLKNSPIGMNDIHSQPEESSQILGKMARPRQIRLTSIEGNWILVSILDVTSHTYTGYVQWRNTNGQYYLFPDIK